MTRTRAKQGRRDLEKELYWRNQIESWKVSGLSQPAFCRREQLNFHTFSSWTYIIRERDLERREQENSAGRRTVGKGRVKKIIDPIAAVRVKNARVRDSKAKGTLFVKAIVEGDEAEVATTAKRSTSPSMKQGGFCENPQATFAQSIAAELYS